MTDDTASKSETGAKAHRGKTESGPHLHDEPVDPQFATIKGKVHPEPEKTRHEDAPWVQEDTQPKPARISTSLIAGLVMLAAGVALILILAV